MIRTNHRPAAAVLTPIDSVNTTLVGGSITFKATSMDITGTYNLSTYLIPVHTL
jgi:hypothetical protein